jgi:hypothetical protein
MCLSLILTYLTNDIVISVLILPPYTFTACILILLAKIYGFSFKEMFYPTVIILIVSSLLTIIGLGIYSKLTIGYQGGYRLADVVKGFNSRYSDDHFKTRLGYSIHFPYSIAQRYVKVATSYLSKELIKVMKEVEVGLPPPSDYNNSLVVHLRLGDVMELNKTFYIKKLNYYTDTIAELPRDVENVVIVGSDLHDKQHDYANDNENPSIIYRNKVAQIFKDNGYVVKFRYNQEPDADMIYMSHAPYFVVGNGGFSHIASMLVEYNGGVNFGYGQTHPFFLGATNEVVGNWHS